LIDKKYRIYSRKESTYQTVHHVFNHQPAVEKFIKSEKAIPHEFDLQKEMDRILLSKYSPASVLVNKNLEVLQFRGHTGNYLEHSSGSASMNLIKMAREMLSLE